MRVTYAVVAVTGVAAVTTGAVLVSQGHARTHTVEDTSTDLRIGATEAQDAESYWTPQRLASATPVGGPKAAAPAGPQVGERSVTAQAVPKSAAFGGIPTVGAVFFNNGKGNHYCTASVVHSYSKSLLLTAAHCIHGGRGGGYSHNVAFVPKFDNGKRPYGIWSAKMLMVDKRWASNSDPDLDYGFIAVYPRGGRKIEQVVGYNKLAINQGVGNWVNIAGYPSRSNRPIFCKTKTARQWKYQIRMDCTGFYGGTSGSPWLLWYNSKSHTGYVNGVVGGYQEGGSVSWRSYSPYFDKDVYNLRSAADKRA
ncbi:trypsin-like serine peptidase [Actinomadura logoneensis]|uniref:trypsin-like serine peptidase n=1 Tax=Actinomadura logoneensis TaxID=2293572 RepID=UPI0011C164C7|nr:trypsin-like peptidase domain-containing protein [Actinomadura logoneensis]